MCVLLLPSPACKENRDSQPCPGVPGDTGPRHHNISVAFPRCFHMSDTKNSRQSSGVSATHQPYLISRLAISAIPTLPWLLGLWEKAQKKQEIVMPPPKPAQKFQGGKITDGKLCLWKELECHCLCVLQWDRARSPKHQAFALATGWDHGLHGLLFWPRTEFFIFFWSYTGSSDHVSLDVSHAEVARTIFVYLCPLGQHNRLPLLFQSHDPTQQNIAKPSLCHYPRWCFTGSGGSETPLCLEIPLKKKK